MVMTSQKPLQRRRKSAKRENPSIRIVSLENALSLALCA